MNDVQFQRKVKFRVMLSLSAVFIVLAIVLVIVAIVAPNVVFFEIDIILRLAMCGIILLLMISSLVIPPDFEYCIVDKGNSLVFSFSDYDCREIKKPFSIQKKARYILLENKATRIRIAYDEEVLEFLKLRTFA